MTFSNMLAESDRAQGLPGKLRKLPHCDSMGLRVGPETLQALSNIVLLSTSRAALWGDADRPGAQQPAVRVRAGVGRRPHSNLPRQAPGEPEHETFSMDDAKEAGLLGKAGPWTQYKKRMRQMRARAFALRDVFPMLRGMPVAEEVQDMGVRRAPHGRCRARRACCKVGPRHVPC